MKKLIAVAALAFVVSTSANAVPNLLVNGDFETGSIGTQPPAGWTYGNAGWGDNPLRLQTDDPTTGAWFPGTSPNGGKVASRSYGGTFNGNHWIAQTVATTPGGLYTFSGYYAGGVGGNQALPGNFASWYQVGMYNGGYSAATIDGGGAGQIAGTDLNAAGDFAWKSFSGSLVATGTSITVWCKYGAVNSNWNYYRPAFDGLVVVPEPSSLLAIVSGLAGMAGLIIRKRA